jgi:hypothetical protein
MNLQYISDEHGRKQAVIISIKDWESLKRKFSLFYEHQDSNKILDKQIQFKEAIEQVKNHKSGRIKLNTIDKLLNEL